MAAVSGSIQTTVGNIVVAVDSATEFINQVALLKKKFGLKKIVYVTYPNVYSFNSTSGGLGGSANVGSAQSPAEEFDFGDTNGSK